MGVLIGMIAFLPNISTFLVLDQVFFMNLLVLEELTDAEGKWDIV